MVPHGHHELILGGCSRQQAKYVQGDKLERAIGLEVLHVYYLHHFHSIMCVVAAIVRHFVYVARYLLPMHLTRHGALHALFRQESSWSWVMILV